MKTAEMWGIRFSHVLILMGCETQSELDEDFDKLADDLREYGAVVMEAEDEMKPYMYMMFKHKDEAEAFYERHKDEEPYNRAKLRLIKEPALVPEEWLGKTYEA